jgi:dynein heavy chain
VPLMERIAWKIADKVCGEVNIRTLLHRPPEQAKKLIEEAKTVLDHWYNTYMDVRQKIEESGTDHRWQFDRKRLFEQTNYMAKVCQDLVEVRTYTLNNRGTYGIFHPSE